MILYKIKNKEGKYSNGGFMPKWYKDGKVWTMPGLKSHLTSIVKYSKSLSCYQDCELVTFTELQDSAKLTLKELLVDYEQKLVVSKLKG